MSERVSKANREALVNIILRHTKGSMDDDEVAVFAEAIERAGFRRRMVTLDVECSKCGARDERSAQSRSYTGPTGPCKECGGRTFPLGEVERRAIRKKQSDEANEYLNRIFGDDRP